VSLAADRAKVRFLREVRDKRAGAILSTGPESGSWIVSAARGEELCGLSGCSGSPFVWSVSAEMGCCLARVSHFPHSATRQAGG
jgi:hypothetical protein